MQLVFWPDGWTVLFVFIVWPTLQVGAALLSRLPADRHILESCFYACHSWERNGKFYDKVFKIRKWKHLLPDGGALSGGYAKRNLTDFSKENLSRFVVESCRAELSHWLAILPFWVFGFFAPPQIMIYMFAYAVIINLPCILAQRFNRPRIAKLVTKNQ